MITLVVRGSDLAGRWGWCRRQFFRADVKRKKYLFLEITYGDQKKQACFLGTLFTRLARSIQRTWFPRKDSPHHIPWQTCHSVQHLLVTHYLEETLVWGNNTIRLLTQIS